MATRVPTAALQPVILIAAKEKRRVALVNLARSLLAPPNARLNPARRIRARAIELNARDSRALHDSGCCKLSPGHMMAMPHVSCQWR